MKYCLVLLFLFPASILAYPKKIKLHGAANYFAVPSGIKELEFEAISKGNLTSILEIEGNIPRGAKVKVFTSAQKRRGRGKKGEEAFYRLKMYPYYKFQESHSECLDISIQTEVEDKDSIDIELYPEIDSPVCSALGTETLSTVATQLKETFGGDWRPGNACSYLLSVAGDVWLDPDSWCEKLTPEEIEALTPYGFSCMESELAEIPKSTEKEIAEFKSSISAIHLKGEFLKDSCKKTKKYRLKILLDLKNARIERDTIKYFLRVKEIKRKVGKEAALKPHSEGRYSPRPILMMNWMNSSCGNKMHVTKWKKGRPKRHFAIDVYSLLSHRDMVLALGVVDSALIGGKGVATLSNGNDAYSVCFSLKRERQNKNGYPF